MAKPILEQNLVQAKNIDTYNASFYNNTTDIDNGTVFTQGSLVTGKNEVYTATIPTDAKTLGVWMAANPIRNILVDSLGNEYAESTAVDPRIFTNIKGKVFSGIKPQVGDIITLSADGISGTYTSGTTKAVNLSTAALTFANATASDTLSFEIEKVSYISVAGASNIGSQRVLAYQLRCVTN